MGQWSNSLWPSVRLGFHHGAFARAEALVSTLVLLVAIGGLRHGLLIRRDGWRNVARAAANLLSNPMRPLSEGKKAEI